ncbi:hypothetical protein PYCCODRAFT_1270498 [Trametes coccinea BRFM310]|uniref:Uncharacterized protein n=1 Tax=Trametes coccinea (strain BRFM310) TaxID=1353009 RepID=A0A1Y2IV07_TRAC3|nr:hypothetical protein PYCCODRAFT_1270498 [Trametes coccinea BRFM310]
MQYGCCLRLSLVDPSQYVIPSPRAFQLTCTVLPCISAITKRVRAGRHTSDRASFKFRRCRVCASTARAPVVRGRGRFAFLGRRVPGSPVDDTDAAVDHGVRAPRAVVTFIHSFERVSRFDQRDVRGTGHGAVRRCEPGVGALLRRMDGSRVRA